MPSKRCRAPPTKKTTEWHDLWAGRPSMKEWSRVIFTSLLGMKRGMKIQSDMTLKDDFETEKYIHIIHGPPVADIVHLMQSGEINRSWILLRFCFVFFRNCKDHTYSELTDRSCHMHLLNMYFYYIYLSGFVKTWIKKFQVHFNYLTSKWNGK